MSVTNENAGETISFEAIGHFRCTASYRFEVPRQAVLADNEGHVEFLPHRNFDQAISDLCGFDRIWIIYQFHLNTCWRTFVRPPRVATDKKKISVFATRAPHRPNSIGMSCVKLDYIDGLNIYVKGADILDGSPILDVKPYVPYCDSFPGSATGWLPTTAPVEFRCSFSDLAKRQIAEVNDEFGLDLGRFAQLQLLHEPTNPQTKRIRIVDERKSRYWLGCRTWRIYFRLMESDRKIVVENVATGYHDYELAQGTEDKYEDKQFHRDFVKRYPFHESR